MFYNYFIKNTVCSIQTGEVTHNMFINNYLDTERNLINLNKTRVKVLFLIRNLFLGSITDTKNETVKHLIIFY